MAVHSAGIGLIGTEQTGKTNIIELIDWLNPRRRACQTSQRRVRQKRVRPLVVSFGRIEYAILSLSFVSVGL